MKRSALLMATLALVAASCGDDAATSTTAAATTSTTSTTSTVATTTTAAATTTSTTTTTAASTTTTGPTTTTTIYTVVAANILPEVFGVGGDPNGSGCVVGADTLPAGVWFGFATAFSAGTITFDLACFFTGAAATAAAMADGAEVFDFYIRNQNPKTYSVPVSTTADVFITQDSMGGIDWMQISTGEWPSTESYTPCPGQYCSVWLYVNGGEATAIVEQYLP